MQPEEEQDDVLLHTKITETENDDDDDLRKILEGLTIDNNKDEVTTIDLARVTPEEDSGSEPIYDFVDLEPVELFGGRDTKDDAFTEEELINVLRSFDQDEEDNDEVPLEFPEGAALPELEFDTADDSLLLGPAEFTASIFDPKGDNDDDAIEVDEEILVEEPREEKKAELDEDDLGLLESLQNLNLDEEVPPFLWCQPCTPHLDSIDEDQQVLNTNTHLSQIDQERPKLPEKVFDSLLPFSLFNLPDGGNPYLSEAEMDELFQQGAAVGAVENTTNAEEHNHQSQSPHDPPPQEQEEYNVSHRKEALEAAGRLLSHFVANAAGLENERLCIGHQDTIFGTAFSDCGHYLATASQDSTVRVWNVATNTALTTLTEHSTEYECLRVAWASSQWAKDAINRDKDSPHAFLLASAGADGTVKIWASKDPQQRDWKCVTTLDHTAFDRIQVNPDDEKETPQVYAVQWIDHWSGLGLPGDQQNSFLLTSSDDFVHLWELEETKADGSLSFREVMSLHFSSFHNYGYGVSVCQVTQKGLGTQPGQIGNNNNTALQKPFGGDRNPNNMIFAFDADYCPANGLLGVALSDGSLRLINGRGICISIMQLPGCQSHLTSFSWDSTGTRLATCVATGHVILWGVTVHDGMGSLTTTCAAILEGGHQVGRPVFGSRFFAEGENLLLTWGVDGRLCVWDSFSHSNIHAPITTLVSNADYPIYAVAVQKSCVAVGGGGGGDAVSFLGIPVHLYDTARKGT